MPSVIVDAPPVPARPRTEPGPVDWPSVEVRPPAAGAAVLRFFVTTLFISALLLFLVQPMVGKMILPMLGGTPAVWNTCMVFFQAVLLAGYAYVHATARLLGVRRQAAAHMALLLVAALILPINLAGGAAPPTSANPVWWLLGRLLVTVGPVFFVVSATAPMLQMWFARTDHPTAADPYFLYAASNCGSLLALLAYPLLVEPTLWLTVQTQVWAVGYGVLVVMMGICAIMVWRSARGANRNADRCVPTRLHHAAKTGEASDVPTLRRRLFWIVTAFVPSSLMLGVTAHVTTNLAAVPLLWVIPLAIYLLTFVLVFARRPIVSHTLMVRLLPVVVLPFAFLTLLEMRKYGWVLIPFHLGLFFIAAMVCHGALARSRPPATHLTEFYLWMSVGGVLGGLFNAVIAPLVFTSVLEYPLAIVFACMLRPRSERAENSPRALRLDILVPAGLAVCCAISIVGLRLAGTGSGWLPVIVLFVIPAWVCFGFRDRPVRLGLGVGVLIAANACYTGLQKGNLLHASRNFFGVKRVVLDSGGQYRKLLHGSTHHGLQRTDPAHAAEPISYYHQTGPVGDMFSAFAGSDAVQRIGVIGLGTGCLATYVQPGQHITFYEIDPAVARIAGNPEYFTFLDRCRGTYDVVLGDGRLTLSEAPDANYGMIVLDAFSSDAIPTHLLTREAMQLYLSKLEHDGVLIFHISNLYLTIAPLVGNLASEAGLACLSRADLNISREMRAVGKRPSRWVAMSRNPASLRKLADYPGWDPIPSDPDTPVWSDQYSNILSLLRWR